MVEQTDKQIYSQKDRQTEIKKEIKKGRQTDR
jgi:hypothetical protein